MKSMIHFTSKDGKIVTVNPDQVVLRVDHKEKKAEICIGYKDYEISVEDAFDLVLSINKDCYFICNKIADPNTAQGIFQECVRSEIPAPSHVLHLSENQFIQLQKKIKALFIFTLQYLGFDPEKCDMSFAQETFDRMKYLRSKASENNVSSQLSLIADAPKAPPVGQEQPQLCPSTEP